MKKRIISLSMILLVGISLNFYACTKKEVADAILTGIIIDSQTGLGLANATLYFTKDLNATDYNNADYTVTTDASGHFTITVVAGNYIIFVVSDGFFVRIISGVSVVTGDNTIDAVTLVNAPAQGSFRVILVWGESPYDLDSHFTGPDGSGGRFHMYYSNKNPNQYVSLDVDDITSYGPETTTVSQLYNGTYRFSVHNYSERYSATGGSGIVSSPAKVELYDHSGLVRSFNPPSFTGSGDTWRVFEIVVNESNFTTNTINTWVLSTSVDDGAQFKNSTKQDTYIDSKNF